MPRTFNQPGIYIGEISVGSRTINGVPTSIAAFIGRAQRGPINRPIAVKSFVDFKTHFGGLCNASSIGFAVRDFFVNGGGQAVILRLYRGDVSIANNATDAYATVDASCGGPLEVSDFLPINGFDEQKGLYALEQTDLFNLLCIPPYRSPDDVVDVDTALMTAAASYCEKRRAMLLLDAPKHCINSAAAREGISDLNNDNIGTRSRNAALFFPRLQQPNPLQGNQLQTFAACGAVAGVFARIDADRGVWKTPAGFDAQLHGVPQLSVHITDHENSELNALGVNCLRMFPTTGAVLWGARTLRGSKDLGDDYKYIAVRRTALFIEESLLRGLMWTAFELNGERLWAQIRLSVDAFMNSLFQRGAFQGTSERDAYFVRCDAQTTVQNDVNSGVVNVMVGFAPLKPAEFLILNIQLNLRPVDT